MNMNKFQEEFSQLLLHYTKLSASIKNETPEITNQQILEAIFETLHTTLNINLQNFNTADFKTPANEIVVTTPNAPDVLKMDYNQNNTLNNRYSLGLASFKSSNLLSEPISEVMETSDSEAHNVNDTTINLDTIDQEESSLKNAEGKETLRDKLHREIALVDLNQRMTMFQTVDEAYQNATKIINKLETLREQLLAPEMRPVRRLSSMMSLTKSKSASAKSLQVDAPSSSNLRSMQRFKAARRSISGQASDSGPLTPTSRLSLPIAPPPSPARQKTLLKKPQPVSARVLSTRLGQHSSSTSSLPGSEPAKPAATVTTTDAKPANKLKTSKYAHVRSTIPKPVAIKRKAT